MPTPKDILMEKLQTPRCKFCGSVTGDKWNCKLKPGLVASDPCLPADQELCPLAIVHESVKEEVK